MATKRAKATIDYFLKGKQKLYADYTMGGGWGCHCSWINARQFNDWSGDFSTIFRAYGHMPKCPKVGETILAEFNVARFKFEIISVENRTDPSDMFFINVKPIAKEVNDEPAS